MPPGGYAEANRTPSLLRFSAFHGDLYYFKKPGSNAQKYEKQRKDRIGFKIFIDMIPCEKSYPD